ncbi:hypothetical protein QQP08_018231 [Theobroma cacao]|nr:hypothetical protein QQP08_018231 [Theobroma cacao]
MENACHGHYLLLFSIYVLLEECLCALNYGARNTDGGTQRNKSSSQYFADVSSSNYQPKV